MFKGKRIVLLISVLLIALFVLAACQSEPTEVEVTRVVEKEVPVEVEVPGEPVEVEVEAGPAQRLGHQVVLADRGAARCDQQIGAGRVGGLGMDWLQISTRWAVLELL